MITVSGIYPQSNIHNPAFGERFGIRQVLQTSREIIKTNESFGQGILDELTKELKKLKDTKLMQEIEQRANSETDLELRSLLSVLAKIKLN